MWLLLAFIAVPLIEIGLFIQVGDVIGLWPTLLIVLITAIAGTWLVRSQGAQTVQNLQNSFQNTKDPTEPLAHGAMILFAGALLLTPGFFTDSVGFLLLFPPFRMFVIRNIQSRLKTSNINFKTSQPGSDEPVADVIEGQFKTVSPEDGPSGWTKD
jgi:UPF0716 protein FxsA